MIYTVTFNPALDYILELDKLEIGKIQKSKTELILPGGKGINVSTVLTNLEIDNIALGYKAGFNNDKVKEQIFKKFNVEPKNLNKQQYDTVCLGYEKAAEKTA